MPCILRGQIAGHPYHVLNLGNGGATIIHKDGDYRAFFSLLARRESPLSDQAFWLLSRAQLFSPHAATLHYRCPLPVLRQIPLQLNRIGFPIAPSITPSFPAPRGGPARAAGVAV